MNEVTIPLKITGISQAKAELRSLKDQILTATDPTQMAELADKAGALQQKLAGVNKQIAEFDKGSNIDQVKNSFTSLTESLENLDFSKANKESANLNQTIKALKPEDLTKQFKGFIGTIGNLGKSFVSLGRVILANPIFLIATIIIAIVVAIVGVLKYFGVLDDVMRALMIPINALIDGFKWLTDSIGLTSFEAEDNAERIKKANEDIVASSKKRTEALGSMYDFEIEKAKISKKDTTDLEINKSKALTKEAELRKKRMILELQAVNKIASEDNAEQRKKLKESIEEENKTIRQGSRERILILKREQQSKKEEYKKQRDEALKASQEQAKEDAEESKRRAKEQAERAKEYAKNRLDTQRLIKDIELSLIQDDAKREEAITKEKYARLRADLLTNDKLTKEERARLKELYNSQEIEELNKANKAILDLEKAHQKELTDELKAFEDSKIEKLQEIEEINYQAGRTARQKEVTELQYHYEQLIAQAKQYGADSTNIEAEYQRKIAEQKKKFSEEDEKQRLASIEKAKAERDAKITFANDIANGITAVGGMLIKDQKKLEQFNKASALVQIGIDTAKAISSLVAMSQSNPLNAVTGGGAGIAQFASGIVQIITNIAKAKSLLSNPSSTPSAGGGGGGGTESSTSVSPATPAIQMFGQGNNLNSQGQLKSSNASQNMVVTAVVSETEITQTQTKISKLQKNAEL
jgi:hypothetical protein